MTNCYFFRGERPLFFVLLSKTNELSTIASAIRQGLAENSIAVKGQLLMAPAIAGEPNVSLEAPSHTRRRIRIPGNAQKSELSCAYSDEEKLPLILRIQPPGAADPPQPTGIRVTSVRVLERPLKWVVVPPGVPAPGPGEVIDIPLQITCPKGGFFSNETTLPGRLRLEIEYAMATATSGWWTELSAPNPWQYPHKAYKLDYIVREVYDTALRQRRAGRLSVDLGMKVHN